MTKLLAVLVLILGAHFAMTYNIPARTGHAWAGWPFATDDVGHSARRRQMCATAYSALASIAVVGFVMATLSVVALWVPGDWWRVLGVSAAVASLLVLIRFFNLDKLFAIGVDLLVIAVAVSGWTVSS